MHRNALLVRFVLVCLLRSIFFQELKSLTGDIHHPSDFGYRFRYRLQTSTIFYEGSSKSFSTYTRLEAKTNSVPRTQQYRYASENFVTSEKSFVGAITPPTPRILAKVSFRSLPHESVTNFLLLLFYANLRHKIEIFCATGTLSKK